MASLDSKRRELLRQECLALQRQNGAFDPTDFVAFASENPESEMHSHFTWDDVEAGHEYRLLQARRLIKLYVRVNGGTSTTVHIGRVISVPSLRGSGEGSYLSTAAVSANEAYRLEVLDEITAKLVDMRDRYSSLLPELKTVWNAIKRVE